MSKEYFMKWSKAAGIRALKTCAQTAVATIGTTAVMEEVSWGVVVSASVLAALLSVLTSLAGLPEVETDGGTETDGAE
ncbi:MAG: holin [Clostridiales bacterium]|nr:holin [Clostridiales bacterium]